MQSSTISFPIRVDYFNLELVSATMYAQGNFPSSGSDCGGS